MATTKIKPEVSIEKITPRKAQELLDTRPSYQRVLNEKYASLLAKDILRGDWRVSGNGITIDAHGHLMDGQHRLRAIVLANASAELVVVRGVSRDTFETIDQGRKRALANFLKGPHAQARAAFLKVLMHLEDAEGSVATRSNVTRNVYTPSDQERFLISSPEANDYALKYAPLAKKAGRKFNGVTTNGLLVGGYYSGNPTGWWADVESAVSLNGLEDGNPLKVLFDLEAPGSDMNVENILRALKAAEYYRSGKKIRSKAPFSNIKVVELP